GVSCWLLTTCILASLSCSSQLAKAACPTFDVPSVQPARLPAPVAPYSGAAGSSTIAVPDKNVSGTDPMRDVADAGRDGRAVVPGRAAGARLGRTVTVAATSG